MKPAAEREARPLAPAPAPPRGLFRQQHKGSWCIALFVQIIDDGAENVVRQMTSSSGSIYKFLMNANRWNEPVKTLSDEGAIIS